MARRIKDKQRVVRTDVPSYAEPPAPGYGETSVVNRGTPSSMTSYGVANQAGGASANSGGASYAGAASQGNTNANTNTSTSTNTNTSISTNTNTNVPDVLKGAITSGAGQVINASTGGEQTEEKTEEETEEKTESVTYEEMLEKIRDTSIEGAEAAKAEAERQAAVKYQRDIVDANTAHLQNTAKYGANAEALAEQGLMGSGYSDYHNAASYGQMRDEIQYAGAVKYATEREAASQRDETVRTAKAEYDTAMAQKTLSDETEAKQEASEAEREKKNVYLSIISGVGDGSMSDAVWRALAAEYGLSDADIKMIEGIQSKRLMDSATQNKEEAKAELLELALTGVDSDLLAAYGRLLNLTDGEMKDALDIATSINTANENTTYAQNENYYLANPPASVADLDVLVKTGEIRGDTGEAECMYNQIKERIQKNTYDAFVDELENYLYYLQMGTYYPFSSDAVVRALEEGNISQEHFDKICQSWSATVDTSTETFKYSDGTLISAKDGYALVKEITQNPLCTKNTAGVLLRSLDNTIGLGKAISESFGYRYEDGKIYVTSNEYIFVNTYEQWMSFIDAPSAYISKNKVKSRYENNNHTSETPAGEEEAEEPVEE